MFVDLSHRSSEIEIMDDLSINEPVVFQTLKELDFINSTLGGNKISLTAFNKAISSREKISVMDLGSGSGELLRKMCESARLNNTVFEGYGIDANPFICQYAQQQTKDRPSVFFDSKDVLDPDCYKQQVDIIHACLFIHHFSRDQIIWLLRQWKNTARQKVIINDLHRHPIAYYSIKWLTNLFSKSSMVKYDAPLSVARGFTRKDWIDLLEEADITNYSLKWKWAFRWLLVF